MTASGEAGISQRRLRGALLGTGSISTYHAQVWQNIPDVQIVALADRDRARARERGRQLGVEDAHIYDNHRSMFAQETLDFVDIATPPHLHHEHVLAAAAHGVHVLCQKPFATSMDEAVAMIEACEAASVRCVVNENWRWRRWYRTVKQMLDAGLVGHPRYARFIYHADNVLPKPDGSLPALLTRQAYTREMPRLILYEWGIHLVDVMRFLFGDVTRVYTRMSHVSPLVRGEDLALLLLEFESGLVGLIDISWGSYVPSERRLERGHVEPFVVEGDAGTIELDPYRDDLISVTTADGTQQHAARGGLSPAEAYHECFLRTQRHFVECLRTGQLAENEARDNLQTFAITMAAYASAEQHAWVRVDQLLRRVS